MHKPLLKIFLDTEFTGLHQSTTLVSLALVAESGEEFYAEFTDYDKQQISLWIEANVISKLFLTTENQQYNSSKMYIKGSKAEVKASLVIWLNQFVIEDNENVQDSHKIQIWADVPHYDWVLFCDLFGGPMPSYIHYICVDVATYLYVQEIAIDIARKKLVDTGN